MKTIFDKVPLSIRAGETVQLSLPAPFHLNDSLFLLVHHAIGQVLSITLKKADGETLTENFTLESFPAILAFSQGVLQNNTDTSYDQVCFTSFMEFDGSLTYRVRNPERVMATYRKV